MIRIGTAGWQYRDWAGKAYPKPKPRGFDELSYLAGFFSMAKELEQWADRTRVVAGDSQEKYVAPNNHNLGKAVVNAFALCALLGRPVEPPPQLVAAHPELRDLAAETKSLFSED